VHTSSRAYSAQIPAPSTRTKKVRASSFCRIVTNMKQLLLPLILVGAMGPDISAQLSQGWAPEIEVKSWMNNPPGTSLEDLRGRVVFLEFWATW